MVSISYEGTVVNAFADVQAWRYLGSVDLLEVLEDVDDTGSGIRHADKGLLERVTVR